MSMDRQKLKELIDAHEESLVRLYNFFGWNKRRIRGNGNLLKYNGFMKMCETEVVGSDNVILIEARLTRVTNCKFIVHGSNNFIKIGQHVILDKVTFCIEDNDNYIEIGDDTWVNPNVEFAAIEGTRINVGSGCMLSSNIFMRTGDSHSILDSEHRLRINPSKDISIGKRVWIGNGVRVLKGAIVGDDCIVSTGAIVTGHRFRNNCVLGGVPAKVIKEGVCWDRSRKIPFLDKD